jgi:Virulence factor
MNSTITIILWRDIPAQVVARAGRTTAKRELSPRFAAAIDRAAMKSGAKDSETYLAEWRRGEPQACDGDLEAEAERAAGAIETAYDDSRLAALVKAGGRELKP